MKDLVSILKLLIEHKAISKEAAKQALVDLKQSKQTEELISLLEEFINMG